MKCPGQDSRTWGPEAIFESKCPECGGPVEFFKDESSRKCRKCGHKILNPKMDFGCAAYCRYAAQCLGEDMSSELLAKRTDLLKDRVAAEVKKALGRDFRRIGRALKVVEYSGKLIKAENADPAAATLAAYLSALAVDEAPGETRGETEGDIGDGIAGERKDANPLRLSPLPLPLPPGEGGTEPAVARPSLAPEEERQSSGVARTALAPGEERQEKNPARFPLPPGEDSHGSGEARSSSRPGEKRQENDLTPFPLPREGGTESAVARSSLAPGDERQSSGVAPYPTTDIAPAAAGILERTGAPPEVIREVLAILDAMRRGDSPQSASFRCVSDAVRIAGFEEYLSKRQVPPEEVFRFISEALLTESGRELAGEVLLQPSSESGS